MAWKDNIGRGSIGREGDHGMIRAHRAAYELFIGPIPEGMSVLHKCDNPSCVNPAHLFLGTQKDNIADMDMKGRRISVHGEHNFWHKLTSNQVRKIRALYQWHSRKFGSVALSKQYCVSSVTIRNITNGKKWREVI